jgi:hypothetical protein
MLQVGLKQPESMQSKIPTRRGQLAHRLHAPNIRQITCKYLRQITCKATVRAPDLAKDRLIVALDRLVRLAKGVIVHRIHPSTYSPVGGVILFNDSDHGDARFSPLRDVTSAVIPTIYAGTTTECSLMESVFHDVPLGIGPTNLDPARLNSLVRSEIQVIEELLLIDLTSVGLRFFGLKNTQLIDTDAADYKLTRSWAEVLYDRNPEAQGLYFKAR